MAAQRDPWNELRTLLEVAPDEHATLLELLDRRFTSSKELQQTIGEAGLESRVQGVRLVVGLAATALADGRTDADEESKEIASFIANRTPDDETDIDSLQGRFKDLYTTLGVRYASAATHAAQARGQNVGSSSVIMDLTPVFLDSNPGAKPLVHLATHTLVIKTMNIGGSSPEETRTSFFLDADDLRTLRKQIDDSLRAQLLSQEYLEGTGSCVWEPYSEEAAS